MVDLDVEIEARSENSAPPAAPEIEKKTRWLWSMGGGKIGAEVVPSELDVDNIWSISGFA